MDKSNYVIWTPKNIENACVLSELRGVEKTFLLNKGVSLESTFPASASYTMNPDFPTDTMLTDNLINTDMLIVGSLRLKKFLCSRKVTLVEYLPVSIFDHKGKIASGEYFIIHPVDPVECIDIDQSIVEWGLINPDTIDSIERLVINEAKIDSDRQLFRPKLFTDIILVKRGLAGAIDQEGFSGIQWVEVADYPEQ